MTRILTHWRATMVFSGVAIGVTSVVAIVMALAGWTVASGAWAGLVPVAMWAPALARLAAHRTVDRDYVSPFPLRRFGRPRAFAALFPLALPLAVYGAAYAVAVALGKAHWSPGGGKWTTPGQIVANLAVNLLILGVAGTFTAMGEEIGWRGYLQPRLDSAGVRFSLLVVAAVELAYHAPLIIGAGYLGGEGPLWGLASFALGALPWIYLITWACYRAGSVWPAILLHSSHNTISQWLFPKLFTGGEDALWLGESGILPQAGYWIAAAILFLALRRSGAARAEQKERAGRQGQKACIHRQQSYGKNAG